MKKSRFTILATALLATGAITPPSFADVFELRTYTANEGKLDALNALFKKHGIESLGYWVPTDAEQSKNTLISVIKHASRDAAKASWKAFVFDPEWKKVAAASQVAGKILSKRPESIYMKSTDYSAIH